MKLTNIPMKLAMINLWIKISVRLFDKIYEIKFVNQPMHCPDRYLKNSDVLVLLIIWFLNVKK